MEEQEIKAPPVLRRRRNGGHAMPVVMTRLERSIIGTLLLIFTSCTGAIGVISTLAAREAASYPYDNDGRYYDGMVVHHAGSAFGWGTMALGAWVLTFLLGRAAYRVFLRGKPASRRA